MASTARMSQQKFVSSSGMQPTGTSPPRNIILFGETGAGKSSLVNLIAGRPIAVTSNDVKRCTSRHEKYELHIDNKLYTVWDTAGLSEDPSGTPPAESAEKHLKQLLYDLAQADGIHLLVFCIRASRLRPTWLNHYNLIYSAVCRKKVPIVAVVTGLEDYGRKMGDWWIANESELTARKMHFGGHACVTTLSADRVDSPILKQRSQASREAVFSLISSACARDRSWRFGQDNLASAVDVRTMFKRAGSTNNRSKPIVVLYELPQHPLDPIPSTKDTSPVGGHLMDVGGSPHLVYHIRDEHLRAETRFRKQIASRGADLLIFCGSLSSDPGMSRGQAAAFYNLYGGDTRPFLVIVRDAPSDERAYAWWNALNENRRPVDDPTVTDATVCALPPVGTEGCHTAVTKLQHTILTGSLQPVDVVPTGCFSWLMGRKRSPKLDTSTTVQDPLTTWGVWVPLCVHRP